MATPTETWWEIDPHTTATHEILKRYLAAWFQFQRWPDERLLGHADCSYRS